MGNRVRRRLSNGGALIRIAMRELSREDRAGLLLWCDQIEAEADPEETQICHCTDCQTGTGSAFRC
jgi:hypothetical protein